MALSRMNSLMKGSTEYHENMYCGPCSNSGETAEAIGYCTECVENLCKVCMKYHPTFKVFLNHNVLSEPRQIILCKPCSRKEENVQSSGYCLTCKESLCPCCYDFHQRPSASREHRLINKPDMSRGEVKAMLALNSVPKGPSFTVPSLTAENIDKCVPCLTKNEQVNASCHCIECKENMCSKCIENHKKIKVDYGHNEERPPLNWCKPCARRMQRVDADVYCTDCLEYICAKCRRYHQFASGLKKHNLLG